MKIPINRNRNFDRKLSGPHARPVVDNPVKLAPFNNKTNLPKSIMIDKVIGAIETVQRVNNAIPPDLKANLKESAGRRFSGRSVKGNGNWKHSSGYTLSKAPTPMPVRLDSGIQPNTYVSDQMVAVYGKCAPLHLTCGYVIIPSSSTNSLNKYFVDTLAFHIQTAAQSNVGFNLNINSDFSSANILTAMNALIYALQIYFYYKSILSYFSNPENNNKGMILLRQNLNPQLLEDLSLLERRLLDTPCPPNLLEYLRYLSGTYASGHTAGSPLLKLCPCSPSFTGVDLSAPSGALAGLMASQNNGVYSLMRRAVPQWIPKNLYDVPTDPLYDENFKTIFANLPFCSYYSASAQYVPAVTNDTTPIQYNAFTEALDGAAYALAGLNITGSGFFPSLWFPLGTGASRATSSRISYYVDSSNLNEGFYGSDVDPYLTRSRPETYQLNDAGTDLNALHLPGANVCQIVTASTIRETINNVLEYLMTTGSISKTVENAKFMPDRSGRRSKRKGK